MASPGYTPNVVETETRDINVSGAAFAVANTTAWKSLLNGQTNIVTAFSMRARAKGGTHATSNFVLKQGANVIGTIAYGGVTAGVRAEATIVSTFARVEKGVELTIDVVETGGSSPTLTDIDIQIETARTY